MSAAWYNIYVRLRRLGMKYIKDICDNCKLEKKVVISNNQLSKKLCASCIANSIDTEKAEDIRKLSMTLEIPFSLKEYYTLKLGNTSDEEVMDMYLTYLSEQIPGAPDIGVFDWSEIDNHYHAAKNFTFALAEITPLKTALEERGRAKWGNEYTFQQIVKLEQIYENTVKQYNINSSLQQDAIKKAAQLSVKMDDLIAANGFKELKDATSAQAQFLKTANIDELVATEDDETIRTVADLALYLEKNGFEFSRMQPVVPEDEIDKLMKNYTENVKEIVFNATGLDQQLKDFVENQKREHEEALAGDAYAELPLAPLDSYDVDEFLEEEERKMDKELETEDFDLVDFDNDELYY